MRRIQVEIITRCNFDCFYCAGRGMAQQNMTMGTFAAILDRLKELVRLTLQGDGEPTLHPLFFAFCDLAKKRGHALFTVTNGTRIDRHSVKKIAAYFVSIGVSIDTLDDALAKKIGRYSVSCALTAIRLLSDAIGKDNVIVYTVDFGQDLFPLYEFVKEHKLGHIVQPVQKKMITCRYVVNDVMRYYSVNGVEMPCCYIKDVSKFENIEKLRQAMAADETPACCQGCRNLKETKR